MKHRTFKFDKSVKFWLMTGVVLIFFQVLIGGITRLTDSGLSITEWAVIQGTIPPLNAEEWEAARNLYMEHAIGQVNMKWSGPLYPEGIPMDEFKFIYFWEYFHRLWARMMGFIFIIPFFYFIWRKKLSGTLIKQLFIVLGITALVAIFGWIMVKSGLNTPEFAWVNGYKLTIHLSLATISFAYLFWVTIGVIQPETQDGHNNRLRNFAYRIAVVVFIQIILGGLMAGTKAGLLFNHFPHMELSSTNAWIWVADVLKDQDKWTLYNMQHYNSPEGEGFAAALIQLLHRGTAYILCIIIPAFVYYIRRIQYSKRLWKAALFLFMILIVQVALGLMTLLNASGSIPLLYGVLHQAFGLILFLSIIHVYYQLGNGSVHKHAIN